MQLFSNKYIRVACVSFCGLMKVDAIHGQSEFDFIACDSDTKNKVESSSKMPSFKPIDVESEYKKDEYLKREDILILRQWLQKQPHLPKINELQLILFLQSCYYRIEATKTTIDNYFTVRTLCPEILTSLSGDDLKQHLSVASVNVLPKKTPEGYAVIWMRLKDFNAEHYFFAEQVKLLDMVMTIYMHQYGCCNGIVTVSDMKGLSFMHLTRINLTTLKKFLYFVQEATPIRIKGIHYVNVVPFADKVIGMAKPFLRKELFDMINLHTNSLDSLYKDVPKDILPEDYGGGGESIAALDEATSTNLLDNEDFFKWIDSQKVDESKRQGKPKSAGNIFGVEGTFKKLEVD